GVGKRRDSSDTVLQLTSEVETHGRPRACRVSRITAHVAQETVRSGGIYNTSSACVGGALVVASIIAVNNTTALLVAKAIDPETGSLIAIKTEEVTAFAGFAMVRACVISNVGDVLVAWISGSSVPLSIRGMKYDVSARSFGSSTTIVSADVTSLGFDIEDSRT